ncbi:MAG: hypothetical protein HYU29_04965 [Chloroflexi bacterium]|nr:hypothetical protein [Chloroflexota bacterium]
MSVLPFGIVVGPGNEAQEASQELELAAVLCLAEKHRSKWRGWLAKQPPEHIEFLSRLLWPFYISETGAAFDGLGLFKTQFKHESLAPWEDLEAQLREAIESESAPKAFIDLLRQFSRGHQGFYPQTAYTVAGYIADRELVARLIAYSKAAFEYAAAPQSVILSPRVSQEVAIVTLRTLSQLLEGSRDTDSRRLEDLSALIKESCVQVTSQLDQEEVELMKRHHQQREGVRPGVEKQVRSHQESIASKTASVRQGYEPLISGLEVEISQWQRAEEEWKDKPDEYARSLSRVTKAKDAATRRLNRVLAQRDKEVEQIVHSYANLIDQEWAKLESLERGMEHQMKGLKAIKEETLDLSSQAEKRIDKLRRRLRSLNSSAEDGRAKTVSILQGDGDSLNTLYVPVWIALFESPKGKRVKVIPPMVFKGHSSLGGRVSALLRLRRVPLKYDVTGLGQVLGRRLEQAFPGDASLAQEVIEKGSRSNVLGRPETTTALEKGLRHLVVLSAGIKDSQARRVRESFLSIEPSLVDKPR